jgi:hypothetical protein
LIPTFQPLTGGSYESARRKNSTPSAGKNLGSKAPRPGTMLTQHTGLPPRAGIKPVARPGKAKPR